eukprot:CAMPEP_0170496712 /NCGR_PEP_ID=MMETSP0208-20121228/22492_1 /TAXON_ID=197538 /ORGANISM="Strombidium inclinatum, Strain S3" /LENGTH=67 /DNA_ID=CAMNT_0010773333 /DNA_START=373 /DNA_END=576 /DNA_ORIENTATION=+
MKKKNLEHLEESKEISDQASLQRKMDENIVGIIKDESKYVSKKKKKQKKGAEKHHQPQINNQYYDYS